VGEEVSHDLQGEIKTDKKSGCKNMTNNELKSEAQRAGAGYSGRALV
jgi:hypothetical protein